MKDWNEEIAARVWLGVALALLLLMPTSESIWIDEALLLRIRHAGDFSEACRMAASAGGSEVQMPLATLFYWACGQVAGWTETALRLCNLVPLAAGVVALAWVGKRLRAGYLPVLLAANPFVWYYANEIRPYSLQIAAGCGLAAGLLAMVQRNEINGIGVSIFGASALIASGASMLGVFCAGGAALSLVPVFVRQRMSLTRNGVIAAVVVSVPGALLAAYFWSTLRQGSGGFRGQPVTLGNIGFAIYELLGFGGLGPGRGALRDAGRYGDAGLAALLQPSWLSLSVLAGLWIVMAVLVLRGLFSVLRGRPSLVSLMSLVYWTAIAGALSSFAVAAWVIGFPFWGRHIAAVLPLFLCAVAATLSCLRAPGWTRCAHACIFLLITVLLVSSLRQRWLPEYRKDDYRGAVAIANDAARKGAAVWWAAAAEAASYYNLSPKVRVVISPSEKARLPQEAASCIVLSKKDLFDSHSVIDSYLQENRFVLAKELPSFKIYQRQGEGTQ